MPRPFSRFPTAELPAIHLYIIQTTIIIQTKILISVRIDKPYKQRADSTDADGGDGTGDATPRYASVQRPYVSTCIYIMCLHHVSILSLSELKNIACDLDASALGVLHKPWIARPWSPSLQRPAVHCRARHSLQDHARLVRILQKLQVFHPPITFSWIA